MSISALPGFALTKLPVPFKQQAHILLLQLFPIHLVVAALPVALDVPCKCQFLLSFCLPNTILTCHFYIPLLQLEHVSIFCILPLCSGDASQIPCLASLILWYIYSHPARFRAFLATYYSKDKKGCSGSHRTEPYYIRWFYTVYTDFIPDTSWFPAWKSLLPFS